MIRLSKSQVLLIHDQLIAETGGSYGLRDKGLPEPLGISFLLIHILWSELRQLF